MTCREKLAIEHPEEIDPECLGGCNGCPHTYGYADKPEWCKNYYITDENCTKCWDREAEEVETQADAEVETETETEVENGIKSSGEMTVFASGALRDKKTGKGRCDLLPACVLLRLARHYENGARKYGERNWQKGIPCYSFADSAMRHLLKYMDGQTDEDHLIAAIWNLCGLAWTEEKRPELMDIPERQKNADT